MDEPKNEALLLEALHTPPQVDNALVLQPQALNLVPPKLRCPETCKGATMYSKVSSFKTVWFSTEPLSQTEPLLRTRPCFNTCGS